MTFYYYGVAGVEYLVLTTKTKVDVVPGEVEETDLVARTPGLHSTDSPHSFPAGEKNWDCNCKLLAA